MASKKKKEKKKKLLQAISLIFQKFLKNIKNMIFNPLKSSGLLECSLNKDDGKQSNALQEIMKQSGASSRP